MHVKVVCVSLLGVYAVVLDLTSEIWWLLWRLKQNTWQLQQLCWLHNFLSIWSNIVHELEHCAVVVNNSSSSPAHLLITLQGLHLSFSISYKNTTSFLLQLQTVLVKKAMQDLKPSVSTRHRAMMKKMVLISLLALLFLQEAASTHLETCDCDEIRALVNASIEQAIARLENKFTQEIKLAIAKNNKTETATYTLLEKGLLNMKEQLFDIELNLTSTMERLAKPIQVQLNYHLPPPPDGSENNPAESCKSVYDADPESPSGYYWIKASSDSSAVRVYCKMDASCGNMTGGWMRVAHIDMTNSSHQCPSGLNLTTRSSAPRRVCDLTRTSYYSCPSNKYSTHGVSYSHVYGRIKAYQNGYPRAFHYSSYHYIDQAYVFGVSLTHGQSPRKHIWTFAGAVDKTSSNPTYKCPCINRYISLSSVNIPSFIGNDYFCDASLSRTYTLYTKRFYPGDPLWDGQGCGSSNTCCSVANLCTNSPPWFIKHLSSSTTDDVEMRMCKPSTDGSTPIEVVELYVQWEIITALTAVLHTAVVAMSLIKWLIL